MYETLWTSNYYFFLSGKKTSMSMVSPMLFLLNPFDRVGSEIKCVGDLFDKIKKMKTDQQRDISIASFVSGLEYFVKDGNHRWEQKTEHLKLN